MPALVTGSPPSGPLYKEVKRLMLAALAGGQWRPGESIPAEPRLAQSYAVSVGTVRKAVDELVGSNILIRQQGRGTYVASHTRERLLFHFFHVVREDGVREYPEVELLDFVRGKTDAVAATHLGLRVGEPVIRIRNRLRLGGRPVIVDSLTLPAALYRGLTERRFAQRPGTIYHLYQHAFGLSVVRTSERLKATLADREAARLLSIARGTPLLRIRRVALAYHDRPVELRVSLVDTAHHEYWAEIGRNA